MVSSLTGLYPDRNGITVANSYDYYRNDGIPTFTTAFKYWTDTVDGADDPLPNMIGDQWSSRTAPAPWSTFTSAGCDVGAVSLPGIELENASTAPSGDITRVFGEGSAEWLEAKSSPALAQTDFVGLAVHCAPGSAFCDTPNARPDDTTTVHGSNGGRFALFGAKYVNPAISGGTACVNATDGRPIVGPNGTCGFPGFDGWPAKNTLGEVLQMQKAGVPVTLAYISDAHDDHTTGHSWGPGEAGYKQQLAEYDAAFATFFQQLAGIGVDRSNTLFVVTVDEGDHFSGGAGTPQPDGSLAYAHTSCPQAATPAVTPCPSNQMGEVTARIGSLLPAGEPAFELHFDMAPTFYVHGGAANVNGPGRTDPAVRRLERDVAAASAPDPYAGNVVPIAVGLADTIEEKALHMVNRDPKRTPTLTMFGNPDFFFQTTNLSGDCSGADVCVNGGFAWNHGGVQEEIGNTWAGFVGPGVESMGVDASIWADDTDVRPTMLALLGLADGYQDDGRVLVETLDPNAYASTLAESADTVKALAEAYKQITAPFGAFATDTLAASTKALASGSPSDDRLYTEIEGKIASLTSRRDWLAGAIRDALDRAEFRGQALNERQASYWIAQAGILLDAAHGLAGA
jgi:hypothetical protein